MATTTSPGYVTDPRPVPASFSAAADLAGSGAAVSWPAVFAGALAAAALSLVLLLLGSGLGLAAASPWDFRGASATTLGLGAIAWLLLTQLFASGLGGYLAGRLRRGWADTQTDEIYFRDTAHGFLSWAVATVLTAALLTSSIASILGTTVRAGTAMAGAAVATAAGGAAAAAGQAAGGGDTSAGQGQGNSPLAYFVDSLFRRDPNAATPAGNEGAGATPTAEAARIFGNALTSSGGLAAEDARYLAQRVTQVTGLAPADAERRVTETFTRLQTQLRDAQTAALEAADKARAASALMALWLFVSLNIGAFAASLAAVYGGRHRDR